MDSVLSQLVQNLYRRESAKRRGPCFVAVAMALEADISAKALTAARIVQLFGRPDYWRYDFGNGLLVYRFDHDRRGRNRDEWYYHLEDGRVISSGFNGRGKNDLSDLLTASAWPPADWPGNAPASRCSG